MNKPYFSNTKGLLKKGYKKSNSRALKKTVQAKTQRHPSIYIHSSNSNIKVHFTPSKIGSEGKEHVYKLLNNGKNSVRMSIY